MKRFGWESRSTGRDANYRMWTVERVMAEAEDELNLYGACVMCRHMKATQLEDILQALQEARIDH